MSETHARDVFDPARHKLVAVNTDRDDLDYRQHVHVSLTELRSDLQTEEQRESAQPVAGVVDDLSARTIFFDDVEIVVPRSDQLALYVGLANAAIARDVPGGTFEWVRENEPFALDTVDGGKYAMDHDTLLRFAIEATIYG